MLSLGPRINIVSVSPMKSSLSNMSVGTIQSKDRYPPTHTKTKKENRTKQASCTGEG